MFWRQQSSYNNTYQARFQFIIKFKLKLDIMESRCAGRFSNQTDNMDMTDNANTISRWTLEVTDEVLGHDQALTERRHQNGDALAWINKIWGAEL